MIVTDNKIKFNPYNANKHLQGITLLNFVPALATKLGLKFEANHLPVNHLPADDSLEMPNLIFLGEK